MDKFSQVSFHAPLKSRKKVKNRKRSKEASLSMK